MDFCVSIPAKIDEIDHAVRAEAGGIDYFGVGEGPLLWSDPYQYLALASQRTSTIKLGTCVTNPITRIAPQTANSVATLNRLAPGRVFMGIGAANNALRSMGRPVAKIRETEHCVEVSAAMLRGERVAHRWRGEEREIEFLAPEQGWVNIDDPVEMWIAAGGPRSLGIAARHADTLVYCLGPDPTLIGVIRDKLDEEAKAAGRDPSEIKLSALTWFYAMKPGDTLDDAVNQGFGSGPISSCITNAGLMREHVDLLGEEIVSAAEEAAGTYLSIPPDGSSHYLDIWRKYLNGLDPRHAKIVSKQLCDYFCLYGTPEELQEKVSVMQDAGVDSVSLFLANPMTFERDIEDISGLVGARV
jgi:alkanesulfonate monooxygenase SsuD/methylene tetrahydromethanopterin reductase-like flavin-dependent oxidoreductase (luciferase family)